VFPKRQCMVFYLNRQAGLRYVTAFGPLPRTADTPFGITAYPTGFPHFIHNLPHNLPTARWVPSPAALQLDLNLTPNPNASGLCRQCTAIIGEKFDLSLDDLKIGSRD
jgi:hypothetical protein